MASWMLYVTGVGSLAGLAGSLAERGLMRLGRPARWAWVGAMAVTVAVPAGLVAAGAGAAGSPAPGVPPVAGQAAVAAAWTWLPAVLGSSLANGLLLAFWMVLSAVLLANIRLSAWTLRRNERSWPRDTLEGHRVVVSRSLGPGVVGVTSPRIVLPQWVRAASPSLRRFIELHEVEHVRAGDARLLMSGLLAVALIPWCLPMWWQLDRLRRAMETDCDARVLAGIPEPRAYATALLAMAARGTHGGSLPTPALVPRRRAELERRLRLITTGGGPRSPGAGARFLTAAILVAAVLAAVPAPAPPVLGFERPVADEAGRAATVVLSVGAPRDAIAGSPGSRE